MRCVAGVGLLALVGCNQLFSLSPTREFDAGVPDEVIDAMPHVELLQGPPASVVTAAAERGGHDVIAVGTHGHRGFRRLLLGSVAEDVIRHANCSVFVVHGEHAGETARFKKV